MDSLKRIARLLFGDYAIYQIWQLDRMQKRPLPADMDVRRLGRDDLAAPGVDPVLSEAAWYFGDEADGFGCHKDGQLAAVAFYWRGTRYAQRNSWPIETGAAKLVHVATAPALRGGGVGAALISASAQQMIDKGYRKLYARIWHSNGPSQSAFARAGWHRIGWLLQINPLRLRQPWNLKLRR